MGISDIEKYLTDQSLRQGRIKRIIGSINKLAKALESVDKDLEHINPYDVESFLFNQAVNCTSTYHVEDLEYYFTMKNNPTMMDVVRKMKYKYTPPVKLSIFTVDGLYLKNLNSLGIKTNNQLLFRSQNKSERQKLAIEAQIPLSELTRLVKLSDLTRVFALKATRAQLYYEAGIDTLDKIACMEPEEFRLRIESYVQESNFDGIATLPKEAKFTVEFARELYRLIEW